MTVVIYNDVTTEHENTLATAARLAACCTFYYADMREAMRKDGRQPGPVIEVWLVFSVAANAWRVVAPQVWVEDDEEVATYSIDGRKSEGEVGREILELIEEAA